MTTIPRAEAVGVEIHGNLLPRRAIIGRHHHLLFTRIIEALPVRRLQTGRLLRVLHLMIRAGRRRCLLLYHAAVGTISAVRCTPNETAGIGITSRARLLRDPLRPSTEKLLPVTGRLPHHRGMHRSIGLMILAILVMTAVRIRIRDMCLRRGILDLETDGTMLQRQGMTGYRCRLRGMTRGTIHRRLCRGIRGTCAILGTHRRRRLEHGTSGIAIRGTVFRRRLGDRQIIFVC